MGTCEGRDSLWEEREEQSMLVMSPSGKKAMDGIEGLQSFAIGMSPGLSSIVSPGWPSGLSPLPPYESAYQEQGQDLPAAKLPPLLDSPPYSPIKPIEQLNGMSPSSTSETPSTMRKNNRQSSRCIDLLERAAKTRSLHDTAMHAIDETGRDTGLDMGVKPGQSTVDNEFDEEQLKAMEVLARMESQKIDRCISFLEQSKRGQTTISNGFDHDELEAIANLAEMGNDQSEHRKRGRGRRSTHQPHEWSLTKANYDAKFYNNKKARVQEARKNFIETYQRFETWVKSHGGMPMMNFVQGAVQEIAEKQRPKTSKVQRTNFKSRYSYNQSVSYHRQKIEHMDRVCMTKMFEDFMKRMKNMDDVVKYCNEQRSGVVNET